MKSILLVLTSSYLASCLPPPHPAVIAVRREEELLPTHLRKPALWNPHLQQVLPLTSLLHAGESPVYERAADNVSRQEIYNILTHAGLLPRRHPHHQPDPHHRHHQRVKGFSGHQFNGHQFSGHQLNDHRFGGHQSNHFYSPYFDNPELLQYL